MDQDRFDIDYEGSRILADTRVNGDVKSNKDICLNGFIEGNIYCAGCVIINRNAVVDGDVDCEALFLNGKITGNASVDHKSVLGTNAEIRGGLITTSLEISPGAKIGLGLKLKNASK